MQQANKIVPATHAYIVNNYDIFYLYILFDILFCRRDNVVISAPEQNLYSEFMALYKYVIKPLFIFGTKPEFYL